MHAATTSSQWIARLSRPSLATRTSAATSVLFLAAILAVGVASLDSFRSQLMNVMVAEQNAVVGAMAEALNQKLVDRQSALTLSAKEITESTLATPEAAQHYLDNNTGLFAAFDRSVFLFAPDGTMLAERPFRPNRRGTNASSREYVRDTIATQQPVISQPFMSNVGDDNMVLVMTAPVFDDVGRLIAILTGSVGLTKPGILGDVAKTVIGKTGHLYVVTSDGKLIMHHDRQKLGQLAFEHNANALFDRALKGFQGTEAYVGPDGKDALVSYARVPSSNWIVGAVYPKDEAFQAVNTLVWRFVRILLLAAALVLVAVWALTRYFMRPLTSVTRHLSNYIATGDRLKPLRGDHGSGEIRALTRAFNRLTARLHEREDALIAAMQSYQLITENSTDLITKHSASGVVAYASPVLMTILGISPAAMVQHSLLEFVHPDDQAAVRSAFAGAAGGDALPSIIVRIRHVDQHYVSFETAFRLMISAAGEATHEILCVSRNISDRMQMEARLHDIARTDRLTGLPNRFLLEERFAVGLGQARREGSMFAILMIDIDRFKNINDTLGHGMGDALLKLAASKLSACTRPQDTLARWGGDEFVLLLPQIDNHRAALDIAARCLGALKQPFLVDGRALHLTSSIGVCVSTDASAEADIMLRNADTAMYKAKTRGGDCVIAYATEMSAGAQNRLSMENALFQAVERHELLLYYQPLVSCKTGRIAGVEALLRWQHPELGLVSPAQFIPIAEETGLIGSIGEWVLHTSCAQMSHWYSRGLPKIAISVNLSSRQFRHDGFLGTIKSVLEDTGLDPQMLELELTESLLMDDTERSKAILTELKALGVTVAIDDFGTGYSSLSYLKGFQLDALKIDQAFTADLLTSEANASIVRATIGLAKGLRLRTIAEGVETMAQANYLTEQGCDALQGYLFARPMPPDAFLSFAKASHTYLLPKKLTPERSERNA
jgi:diguanylate cyclase (GGDEF)-like protein/PAS domain S-box-containing protein